MLTIDNGDLIYAYALVYPTWIPFRIAKFFGLVKEVKTPFFMTIFSESGQTVIRLANANFNANL